MSSIPGSPMKRGGGGEIHILAPGREPALGSHMVTPRRGYLHHGIYVGDGKVVHYSGFAYSLRGGPVEEVALADFADGRPVWVRRSSPTGFGRQEIVRRARSRLGENLYRLFTNNCEHFCEWCLHGEARSFQVEALLDLPKRALRAMNDSIVSFVSKPETFKWKLA